MLLCNVTDQSNKIRLPTSIVASSFIDSSQASACIPIATLGLLLLDLAFDGAWREAIAQATSLINVGRQATATLNSQQPAVQLLVWWPLSDQIVSTIRNHRSVLLYFYSDDLRISFEILSSEMHTFSKVCLLSSKGSSIYHRFSASTWSAAQA